MLRTSSLLGLLRSAPKSSAFVVFGSLLVVAFAPRCSNGTQDCTQTSTCTADASDGPPPPPQETKPVEPPPPPQVETKIVEVKVEKPVEWKKESKWPTGKVVSAIGLGVIAVGSFIAAPSFLAVSLSDARDADKLANQLGSSGCAGANASSPQCIQLSGLRSDQSTFGALSATFFVLGALAVVGDIIVLAAWPNVHPLVSATRDGFLFRF